MKVLVVLSQPPQTEGNAPGRCAVGLLQGLESHGVEVRALAARTEHAPPGATPAELPVSVVDVPPRRRGWRGRRDRLVRPHGELLVDPFPEHVRAAAEGADVVHLEETLTGWSDLGLGLPSLVHIHYLAREDRSLGAPWRRQFRDVLEFDLAERAAIRRHRYLVASSPRVAAEIRRRAPRSEVVVAPLSLDPSHYPPAELDGPPQAGLIGTASWAPTAEAVRRLLERIWPEVRKRAPEARLLLAGRGMSSLAASSSAQGIEVVGEVESAPQFLRQLSVLLYPLSHGSGIKVKVLEAIASGLPVVTTAAGAEGIEAGSGVVVHDQDVDLIAASVDLLRDAAERHERGLEARAAFLRRYAPSPATEPLVELYSRMMSG